MSDKSAIEWARLRADKAESLTQHVIEFVDAPAHRASESEKLAALLAAAYAQRAFMLETGGESASSLVALVEHFHDETMAALRSDASNDAG